MPEQKTRSPCGATCRLIIFLNLRAGKTCYFQNIFVSERGSGGSVGIVTELRAGRSGDRIPVGMRFPARPDRPWGPPSLL